MESQIVKDKVKKKSTKPRRIKLSVMFVCTGNTCRSPMMQQVFGQYTARDKQYNIKVSSCGLNASAGAPMSQLAVQALSMLDKPPAMESVRKFGSTQYDPEFVGTHDLIVCMTERHKLAIGAYDNVVLFGDIVGGKDVDDPYGGTLDQYIKIAQYFEYGCQDLYHRLVGAREGSNQ
jgi:protein-tyrosine phosphatase